MQPDKEHHTNDRTTRYIYICVVGMEASTKYMYLPHIMLDMWSVLANSPMSPR